VSSRGELELLGDEEAGGEDRARHQEGRGVADRERTAAEQAQWHHRLADALFPGGEGEQQDSARNQAADDLGARPARLVRANQGPDNGNDAAG